MSPDRLTIRQQLVTIRDHLAAQDTLNRDARHEMWVRVVAVLEDLGDDHLAAEVDRLTKWLHDQRNVVYSHRGHPDYEYDAVQTGRKSGEDPEDKLVGEGWEDNFVGDENHHDSWERFDYTESHHFRRRKPE